jgi:thioredoxin-dependent peroxiredoxin
VAGSRARLRSPRIIPTMSDLRPGDLAPDFSLVDDIGVERRLSDVRGRWTVVYFYPRDDTPWCTVEACEFRDANDDITATGATVWGISPQDARSHAKFREKQRLNFPLLVDTDHAVADRYGTWVEKTRAGRRYWGVARRTFLVDPEGRIARAWDKVTPEGHAADVLAELRARGASGSTDATSAATGTLRIPPDATTSSAAPPAAGTSPGAPANPSLP